MTTYQKLMGAIKSSQVNVDGMKKLLNQSYNIDLEIELAREEGYLKALKYSSYIILVDDIKRKNY